MEIKDYLRVICSKLTDISEKASRLLMGLPKGGLKTVNVKGNRYFIRTCQGEEKHYLGKSNNEIVQKLAARRVAEKMKSNADYDIKLIDQLCERYRCVDPNVIRGNLPDAYKDIPEKVFTYFGFLDAEKWQEEEVKPYDSYPEEKKHRAANGIMMRSKSEVICSDIYTSLDVPQKYEQELIFQDGTTMHPDFTLFCEKENRVILHEHCGMMDDSRYRQSFIWRMQKYVNAGYIPYHDVIFTFDRDGNIDAEEAERLIRMIFL